MSGLARIINPVTFARLFRLHAYACERATREPTFPKCLSQRLAVAIRRRMLRTAAVKEER